LVVSVPRTPFSDVCESFESPRSSGKLPLCSKLRPCSDQLLNRLRAGEMSRADSAHEVGASVKVLSAEVPSIESLLCRSARALRESISSGGRGRRAIRESGCLSHLIAVSSVPT
jgi:hypothetical protein